MSEHPSSTGRPGMIGWWFPGRHLGMASNRIRGELVMRELRRAGLSAEWFSEARAGEFHTLVVGKRYDPESLARVERLHAGGTRIIVDLCDNHFCHPPGATKLAEGAERLRRLVRMADHVIAATATLAEIIRREVPGARVTVIGDIADDLSVIPATRAQRAAGALRRAYTTTKLSVAGRGGRRGIVWFGNHGGPYADAGMSALLGLRESLEALSRERPVFLSVISNSRKKFQELIAPWDMPTHYLKWNAESFASALSRHAVAIVPVTRNEFTDCKTDNRLMTAFGAGLPVVADLIPSYEPYRAVVGTDWNSSLRNYLDHPQLGLQHAAEGRRIAAGLNQPEHIAAQWLQVLAPVA